VLSAAVEPFALSALKYALLALLFLFIWRAMRWVVRGLNVDRSAPAAPRGAATAGPTARASVLVVHLDGQKPRTTPLDGSTTLGRGVECELRLDDTYVSQQHARIFDRGGNWYVEDLGSTNGTYLNQQRVSSSSEVHPGDTLKVGKTVLELRK
jgi:pSer/pThr/pTyr-binding forkhead associated (FHA) protein